jgi:hypothetical protein
MKAANLATVTGRVSKYSANPKGETCTELSRRIENPKLHPDER